MDLKHCAPVLFVKDAQRSRKFYEDVLGLKVVGDFGGLNIIFEQRFALWQIMEENMIPRTLGMDNITNPNATSRFELCFETGDIDKLFADLKQAGVKFLHEINMELWGQRNLRFYDPDNHLVEVGEEMPVFVRRIYEEEGKDLQKAAQRMYMDPEVVKQVLGIKN